MSYLDRSLPGVLTRLGLSADADLLYRALATGGPQLRGTLSRTLGMEPRRVSAALEELVDQHAVTTLPRQRSDPHGDARLWAAAPLRSVIAGGDQNIPVVGPEIPVTDTRVRFDVPLPPPLSTGPPSCGSCW